MANEMNPHMASMEAMKLAMSPVGLTLPYPTVDSIDLLNDIRKIASTEFIPIAITCHIDSARHEKLLRAGFKAILMKPLNKEVFSRLINKYNSKKLNLVEKVD